MKKKEDGDYRSKTPFPFLVLCIWHPSKLYRIHHLNGLGSALQHHFLTRWRLVCTVSILNDFSPVFLKVKCIEMPLFLVLIAFG